MFNANFSNISAISWHEHKGTIGTITEKKQLTPIQLVFALTQQGQEITIYSI
jgi:hypothetical protein